MNIAVIGLGLIGASFAKGFKKFTDNRVSGYDANGEVMKKALSEGVIDANAMDCLGECDIIILGLYPKAAVDFVRENADKISKDAILTDVGGVKRTVCDGIFPIAEEYGFTFIGMHPMAGIEKSGFDFSKADMFQGASLIAVPKEGTPEDKIKILTDECMKLGFSGVCRTTPEEHDRIIAYTSQLAHVVSASYIKSPTAMEHCGFSAGSFKDMTRVAHLNETMWTELFLENGENLAREIDTIAGHLCEFSEAIKNGDKKALFELLKDGREKKDLSDNLEGTQKA